jgi:hypothetical protein
VWFEKDPKGFLLKLEEMEREERSSRVVVGDVGQEVVERLIEKLLKAGVGID